MKSTEHNTKQEPKLLLLVWVYKNGADCSNGGLTSKHNKFLLIDLDAPWGKDIEPLPDLPALRLVRSNLRGREHLHAEPFSKPAGMVGPMMGGSFIYSSDVSFPGDYPVPVHDRFETPTDYLAQKEGKK